MSKGCFCCPEGQSETKLTFAHRLGRVEQFHLCKQCYETIRLALEELHREEV